MVFQGCPNGTLWSRHLDERMQRVVGGGGQKPIVVHAEEVLTKPSPDWSISSLSMGGEKGNLGAAVHNLFSLMTWVRSGRARMERFPRALAAVVKRPYMPVRGIGETTSEVAPIALAGI